MRSNTSRVLGLLTTLALVTVASITPAQAQSSLSITVSPVTFELTSNPGDVLSNVIKVTNSSDATLELEGRVENVTGTGEQGQVQLSEEDNPFALSNWVKVEPKSFVLGPKETKTANFTVTVPKNAEPGGHYGSVLFGTIASSKPGTTGSSITQRVGSLLLVRVSGQAKEDALIKQFYPKTFVGSWDEVTASDGKTKIYVAKDENLKAEQAKRYFNNGPIAFDLTFKNAGNVHVKPVGFVTISNIFGKKVAELAIDPRNVFPGADRRLTIIWPRAKLWGGYYHAQVVSLYGSSNNQSLTADATFWAFPMIPAIIIVAGLIIIIGLRKRLRRVVKVLVRGE